MCIRDRFYVAYRVWQSLARAEPVDVFPLLRPFALGLCIMFFPTIVLGTLNRVMSPIVKDTHSILEAQSFDMNEYRAQKDRLEFEAMKRNPETAYLVDKDLSDENNILEGIIRFGGETVKEVMTSRLDMVDLDIRTSFKEVMQMCIRDRLGSCSYHHSYGFEYSLCILL